MKGFESSRGLNPQNFPPAAGFPPQVGGVKNFIPPPKGPDPGGGIPPPSIFLGGGIPPLKSHFPPPVGGGYFHYCILYNTHTIFTRFFLKLLRIPYSVSPCVIVYNSTCTFFFLSLMHLQVHKGFALFFYFK